MDKYLYMTLATYLINLYHYSLDKQNKKLVIEQIHQYEIYDNDNDERRYCCRV